MPMLSAFTYEKIIEMRGTSAYSEILSCFANYPRRSNISDHSRATLFLLVRMVRPQVIAEVGTLFAHATEVMARALWESAKGIIHTIDPLGAERRCGPTCRRDTTTRISPSRSASPGMSIQVRHRLP